MKRRIYAEHGVGEYWLVDPDARTISVMSLQDKDFREVGNYGVGEVLSSPTLEDLALDLTRIFPSA